jgi:hypothetical protein
MKRGQQLAGGASVLGEQAFGMHREVGRGCEVSGVGGPGLWPGRPEVPAVGCGARPVPEARGQPGAGVAARSWCPHQARREPGQQARPKGQPLRAGWFRGCFHQKNGDKVDGQNPGMTILPVQSVWARLSWAAPAAG